MYAKPIWYAVRAGRAFRAAGSAICGTTGDGSA
jgi:hypothetical protein